MKQFMLVSMLVILFINKQYAQTKLFKEVGNSISSSIKAIIQDDNLVGYLSFTQLERANADSFHYRLTIMDENLNDIGELNFTELKLDLQAVAFEQDVLCLAYLKSNFVGYGAKKRRERKEQLSNASLSIHTQFVSLDGKIITSNTVKANVKIMSAYNTGYDREKIDDRVLKHPIQLKNMRGKGFACFYGDDNKCYVSVLNTAGKSIWSNDFMQDAENFVMLVSQQDIYLLYKKDQKLLEGGYWLTGYNVENNTAFAKYDLRDKNGHSFSVRAFGNDPVTGRPYLAGMILHNRKGNANMTVKQLAHGPYIGAFTAQIKHSGTSDIESVISDWSTRSQSEFSSKGRYQPTKSFILFQPAFKDYDGNAYFAGTSFKRKPRWGAIGATVITSPLIIPPLWILMLAGTQKIQTREALLFKQDKKGNLSYVNAIPSAHSGYLTGKMSLFQHMSLPEYYMVMNSDTKSNYLVVSDRKNVNIYSINQQKVIRTIPRKDGSVTTTIYTAKEGHVMVSEYNQKERTRKFSIESL
ncbi:DUF6770 family protein [Chitinophaga rhizophila]|uniref:Uncharacterized protein n=1 Tax=Chitinophaga rhizophila TaxID=2866212 RepID=A0ABS7GMQ0_9BACT|nr:DUF6770 family protein [Chitinophaga rhizophila]MBW8687973.1 hypothetical protein [Chitinophaga rhizophila]